MVPAGVIIMGKTFPNRSEATMTAEYPARLACELRTSILCASVVRGIISRLIASTPPRAKPSSNSRLLKGSRRLTERLPRR